MKRTGEITLGIIGAVLSIFGVVFGVFFAIAFNTSAAQVEFKNELMSIDPTLDGAFIQSMIDILMGVGWAIVIVSIIMIILGLIGVFSVKGNRKPKLAGAMFIVGAILALITINIFTFILYLIAGIMCFARKQKHDGIIN